jgi:hypothetical protein
LFHFFFRSIMLSDYHKNRRNKTLPVLKTDKDLEAEGLARLSIDLPAFRVTDEPDIASPLSGIESSRPNSFISQHGTSQGPSYPYRPSKFDSGSLSNRHSVGFDVPGAVHTIVTPSKHIYRSF